MSNVVPLHRIDRDTSRQFLASVSAPNDRFNPTQFRANLPDILEAALELLLQDLDAQPQQWHSGAIGCRIIATCIDRLRN